MEKLLNTVRGWMEMMGFKIRTQPYTEELSNAELALRLALHSEECGEVAKAFRNGDSSLEVAEEICDNIWVLLGTGLTCGLPMKEAWGNVCIKNSLKIGKEGPIDPMSEAARRQ